MYPESIVLASLLYLISNLPSFLNTNHVLNTLISPKNTRQLPWDWQGTGHPVEDSGGGRGRGCGQQMQAEGEMDPCTGELLGLTGTWEQVKDGKWGATRQETSVTVLHEETLGAVQQGREAQTSSDGQQMGVPSMCMFNPRPEELGGRSGCKERVKRN